MDATGCLPALAKVENGMYAPQHAGKGNEVRNGRRKRSPTNAKSNMNQNTS